MIGYVLKSYLYFLYYYYTPITIVIKLSNYFVTMTNIIHLLINLGIFGLFSMAFSQVALAKEVSVCSSGCDFPKLYDAVKKVGTIPTVIIIKSGEHNLPNRLVVPKNVEFHFEKGASINITGKLVYTSNRLIAPKEKIFAVPSGKKKVIFRSILSQEENECIGPVTELLNEVYPEWWGADPTGQADSTVAIQKALDSCQKVKLTGSYKTSATLRVRSNNRLEGNGQSTTFITYTGSQTALLVEDNFVENERTTGVKISDLTIQNIETPTNIGPASLGMDLSDARHSNFSEIAVKYFKNTGVLLGGGPGGNYFNKFEGLTIVCPLYSQSPINTDGLTLSLKNSSPKAEGVQANFFDTLKIINCNTGVGMQAPHGNQFRNVYIQFDRSHPEGGTGLVFYSGAGYNVFDTVYFESAEGHDRTGYIFPGSYGNKVRFYPDAGKLDETFKICPQPDPDAAKNVVEDMVYGVVDILTTKCRVTSQKENTN